MKPRDPKLRELLAGEYVLGTLHGRARKRFKRWLEEDTRLGWLVEDWEQRLDTLTLAAPAVKPRPEIWRALKRRTQPVKQKRSFGLWENLMFWRSLGFTTTALALSLLLYIGFMPSPAAYIVVLNDNSAKPAWLVSLYPNRITIKTQRLQSLAPGKSFELWMLPERGQKPRSLGLIPASGRRTLYLPEWASQLPVSAQGLAVSIEPQGGSPTGEPTGPVPYQGPVLSL